MNFPMVGSSMFHHEALRASISSSWVLTVMRLVHVIFLAAVIKGETCRKEPNLAQILQKNGWNYVMVVHVGPITQMCQCLVQELMKRQVYVASVGSHNLVITHDSMFRYLFLLNDVIDYDHLEPLIAATKPQRSAVILNIPSKVEETLLSRIKVRDLYFYLCSQSPHWRIRSVISTPRFSHPVITEVLFDLDLRFIETYDLQGQILYEITVPYHPYIVEADDQVGGMYTDLFETLENKFNFSLSHLIGSNWGVIPIRGTFENGTFGGAMGGVINGAFDLSLSSWVAAPERGPLLDMEPIQVMDFVLAVVPKPLEVDLKFFQHPFSVDAWQGILLVAFLICITIIPPSLILANYENTNAYNWASLSAWSFFLLINSFYGGALTMFFSTKATPPFSHFHEVVQVYPTWILKTLVGTDVYFYERAKSGDPNFKAFYERMIKKPEETTFTSLANVLRTMEEEFVVILADLNVLQSSFLTNPDLKVPIEVLETMTESWTNVILKKHSPLSPIVRKGLNSLRDHAVMEKTRIKWVGQGIPKSTEISAYTLGLGQTFLVYLTTATACILSMMVLGLEHVYARFYSS